MPGVHPAQVRLQRSGLIGGQGFGNGARAGQEDLQPQPHGMIVGRLAHAAGDQHLAIGQGRKLVADNVRLSLVRAIGRGLGFRGKLNRIHADGL